MVAISDFKTFIFSWLCRLTAEAKKALGWKVAGIGASDAAKGIGVPLTLAKEYLLLAENSGVLCRDQGPEGLVFYENFFARL